MLTRKDVIRGYAGFKLTKGGWIRAFAEDIHMFKAQGKHDVARALEAFARDYCASIIGKATSASRSPT
jgi:hypothetical protein